MSLPPAVKVDKLEAQHADYRYYKPFWDIISDLREGATAITRKSELYLPKRPGEDEAIYRLRLAKLSYTPVMANAIREFTAKLAAAPVYVEGSDEVFINAFRDSTDGKGRDEAELLNLIFSVLLYFGRVFVAVDRPNLGLNPRSAFEDLGIYNQPYVTVYEPLNVTNWGDDWYLTRQLVNDYQPLEEPRKLARWTIWTAEEIAVYEAPVKLNNQGVISDVLVNSTWAGVATEKALVPLKTSVKHGLGKCPMLSLTLPQEMWTGSNVYLKQLQHMRIESSWTDAGTMAGTIQRIFTPTPPPPADDPRVVYEEPDYSQIKTDNAHVLVGADFKFVESSGTAIASLTDQLETIERQIKALVSMSYSSVAKATFVQSGASKQVDQAHLSDSMKAYGKKVIQLYQDILQLVCKVAGKPEDVAVFGLDTYDNDTVEGMLDRASQIMAVIDLIPPTALKLWYGKLTSLMTGSRSEDMDKAIAEELDDIFSDAGLDLNNPEDLDKVAQALGLAPEDILEVANVQGE